MMKKSSPEKILLFAVVHAMLVKNKNRFLYGCSRNIVKIAASQKSQ